MSVDLRDLSFILLYLTFTMVSQEKHETIELAQTNQNSLYSEELYKLLFPLQNRENDRFHSHLAVSVCPKGKLIPSINITLNINTNRCKLSVNCI